MKSCLIASILGIILFLSVGVSPGLGLFIIEADARTGAGGLGDSCTASSDCSDSLHLTCNTTSTKCICAQGYQTKDEKLCLADLDTACTADTPCFDPNAACTAGKCTCKSGYEAKAKTCAPDIGTACAADTPCFDPNANCTDSKCACNSGFQPKDKKCYAGVYGSQCNITKGCNPVLHTVCSAAAKTLSVSLDTCICVTGYQVNDQKECLADLGTNCTAATDCFDPNAACDENKKCACKSNYTPKGESCLAYLGINCRVAIDCFAQNAVCGADKTCACKDGYLANGESCLARLKSNCTVARDCFAQNAECDADKKCACKAHYQAKGDYCQADLGTACTVDTDCFAQNAECGADKRCACQSGYLANGESCLAILGTTCVVEADCFAQNTECDADKMCACKSGYKGKGESCLARVSGDSCELTTDCSASPYMTCRKDVVNKRTCVCDTGYLVNSNKTCLADLGRPCTTDTDCHAENAECDANETNKICTCRVGYRKKEIFCVPNNPGDKCSTAADCTAFPHMSCNVNTSECNCDPGYLANNDKICLAELNTSCSKDIDCFDTLATCGANKTCTCKTNYKTKGQNCLARYKMECTEQDGCTTKNAKCQKSGKALNATWTCMCTGGKKYIGPPNSMDDTCSGSIASLTFGAAILSLALRFIL